MSRVVSRRLVENWENSCDFRSSEKVKVVKMPFFEMLNNLIQAQQNSSPEAPTPSIYWNALSEEDRSAYYKVRMQFQHNQNSTGKDRRVATFQKELQMTLKFLERDNIHREERCIISGIAFAGPFICVNTRQLKGFLGRCKSSINGSFQQMGYVALRTKSKARQCLTTIIRPLIKEQALLRQWTIRCASKTAEFCFISTFPVKLLPEITESDLTDDRPKLQGIAQPKKIAPQVTKPSLPIQKNPYIPPRRIDISYSVECLKAFDDSEWGIVAFSDDEYCGLNFDVREIPRSTSACFGFDDDVLKISNDWATF